MMTSAKVVETLVTTTDNSASQDCTHPDDQTTLLHVTLGYKPFTVIISEKIVKQGNPEFKRVFKAIDVSYIN